MMTTVEDRLRAFAAEMLRPQSEQTVVDWCADNLYIPPPQTQQEGWLRLSGREYLREFIDDFANPRITDQVACFGSQTGKTTGIMASVAWSIVNEPAGVLWVMPTVDLARSFAETRWIPVIHASPQLARLKPSGAGRHKFKTTQQIIGAAIINFIGSNSPANLASRPARVVILDEVDKFDEGGRGEADAVNLAEQRTKSFANPKRVKTSTPTVDTGLIWQEFLKGDQRRYFVACVHCGKRIIFAWAKQFTMMPLTGAEAFVEWDKEAKRTDGWDMARVERSARAVCPHCAGHILDGHKTRMVRDGQWQPTATAPAHFRSRHLSSLYASGPQTSFGALAVKFLQAKRSLLGLQGFINGDLAEPYASQDTMRERVELVTKHAAAELGPEWNRLMTVDCQQNAPNFWYVIRAWNNGDSEGIASGYCSTWEDIRALQIQHGVIDEAVLIDSGFGAKASEKSEAEVYLNCARRCKVEGTLAVGWMPAKGMPARKRWKDDKTGALVPWYLSAVDPYAGTSDAGLVTISLFEFSGEFFKDVLANLRAGKAGYRWEVNAACASEEYWRHLDSEIKTGLLNKRTGREEMEWRKRSHRWPNHLLDCEVMQVSLAMFFNFLKIA